MYLTEDEVRTLVDLFDQSKIFKTYNQTIEPRLRKLAKYVFLGKNDKNDKDDKDDNDDNDDKDNNHLKQKRFSSCN